MSSQIKFYNHLYIYNIYGNIAAGGASSAEIRHLIPLHEVSQIHAISISILEELGFFCPDYCEAADRKSVV